MKMKKILNKEDKQAIVDAIERFNLIAAGCIPIKENLGVEKCGLCRMYKKTKGYPDCSFCPISEFTGKPYCRSTPYNRIASRYFVFYKDYVNKKGYKDAFNAIADALEDEITFLIGLLPKKHKLRG